MGRSQVYLDALRTKEARSLQPKVPLTTADYVLATKTWEQRETNETRRKLGELYRSGAPRKLVCEADAGAFRHSHRTASSKPFKSACEL